MQYAIEFSIHILYFQKQKFEEKNQKNNTIMYINLINKCDRCIYIHVFINNSKVIVYSQDAFAAYKGTKAVSSL